MNRSRIFLFRMALAISGALALLAVRAAFVTLHKSLPLPPTNIDENPEDCSFGLDPGLFERNRRWTAQENWVRAHGAAAMPPAAFPGGVLN